MRRTILSVLLLLFAAFCGLLWYVEAQGGGKLYWNEFVYGVRDNRPLPWLFFIGMLGAGSAGVHGISRSVNAALIFAGLVFAFLAVVFANPADVLGGARVPGVSWLTLFVAIVCFGGAITRIIQSRRR